MIALNKVAFFRDSLSTVGQAGGFKRTKAIGPRRAVGLSTGALGAIIVILATGSPNLTFDP